MALQSEASQNVAPQSGSLLLLKIQNDEMNFTTIGGMRSNKFSLNNNVIDTSNKSSGKWRQILGEAGMSSASITGAGVFTDSDAERLIREIAFNGTIKTYQLCFGNGNILEGKFFITHYERTGNYAEEETYAISLESSGKLKYTLHLSKIGF